MVLNEALSSTGQPITDNRPFVAYLVVTAEQDILLFLSPLLVAELGTELVTPPE